MLPYRLRRLANIIPTKTLQALTHKYNREYYFFLNTLLKEVKTEYPAITNRYNYNSWTT